MQEILDVFTAKEWLKDTRNEARLANNLRVETSKSLAAVEGKNKELALKLVVADRDRKSAEAGLRTAKAQAEE